MAFIHTPRSPIRGMCTRSMTSTERSLGDDERPCMQPSGDAVDTETPSTETFLRTAMEELRQMREERNIFLQQQQEITALLRQRDEELQRLREAQLSPSINNPRNAVESVNVTSARTSLKEKLGFKVKPDVFDGSVPLREFLS